MPKRMRYALFAECTCTATKLDWATPITLKGVTKTRIEHFGMKIPKFFGQLRTWGEAGTVKTGKDGKVGDHGVTCMFVGYADNHSGDCYRMYNPNTGRVMETRDVIFLQRMFYEDKCEADAAEHPHVIVEVTKDYLVEAMPSETEDENKISVKSEAGSREGGNEESLLPDPIQSAQEPIPAWARTKTCSGRFLGRRDGQYDPATGKTVSFATVATGKVVMENYYVALAEID